MAKAPRTGDAKTRLVPPLSPAQAAELSACFIRDAVENIAVAAQEAPIEGYVAFSPADAATEFVGLLADGTRLLQSRRPGLAASLQDAADDLLSAGYGAVCLINSDSPTLPTALLVDAARRLAAPGDRIVLGSAEDGGYYLIGLKHVHRRLFEDIAWSTPLVFEQTMQRAREIGVETAVLPTWYDVDDVASLRRLHAELIADEGRTVAGGNFYRAPHSTAFLRDLFRANAALGGMRAWRGDSAIRAGS